MARCCRRTDGSGTSIHTRFYDGSGVQVGAEFQVNTTTTSGQHTPTVLGLSDGRFVVSWVSEDTGDGDGTCGRPSLSSSYLSAAAIAFAEQLFK